MMPQFSQTWAGWPKAAGAKASANPMNPVNNFCFITYLTINYLSGRSSWSTRNSDRVTSIDHTPVGVGHLDDKVIKAGDVRHPGNEPARAQLQTRRKAGRAWGQGPGKRSGPVGSGANCTQANRI